MDSARSMPPRVRDYLDYRQFLEDYYRFRKSTTGGIRPYSYGDFSAAADIKSPRYLKMIIQGQRKLSDQMMRRFCKAMHLDREQSVEFCRLVHYGQAQDPMVRQSFLRQLIDMRIEKQVATGEIDKVSLEKVPNWVVWVVFAMSDQKGVDFKSKTLEKLFYGRISQRIIEKALASLYESGLLKHDPETGEIRKTRELIESPENVPVALIRKLQAEFCYLGMEALYQVPPEEREMSSLTLALTEEEFDRIRFDIRKFRKRIQAETRSNREDSKADRIYQLNVQLFPITDCVEKRSGCT